MATIPKAAKSRQSLQHGQLGLFGVIMPGVAQVAPAFNLFFTTGLMVGLAGASVPLIFLISMARSSPISPVPSAPRWRSRSA
jgi:amino acid transporter